MARNKPNPMLAKIEARHQAEMRAARIFAVQQSKDMMLIAAHQVFGFGPDRAKKLSDAFDEVFRDYAALCVILYIGDYPMNWIQEVELSDCPGY